MYYVINACAQKLEVTIIVLPLGKKGITNQAFSVVTFEKAYLCVC